MSVDLHGVQSQSIISRIPFRFDWSSWPRLTTTFRIAMIWIGFHGQGVARPYRTRQSAKYFTLHWGSIIKQGAIDGQDAAGSYKTRQSAKHFPKPHQQIEYQKCTVGPYGLPNTKSITMQAPAPFLFIFKSHSATEKWLEPSR
jgi:hypothetical protein